MARSKPPSQPGWGAFAKLALDGPGLGLRMVEKGVERRTRWNCLPYGGKPLPISYDERLIDFECDLIARLLVTILVTFEVKVMEGRGS